MLITRAPFRISFFGGGTDYQEYFSAYGGSVLSTTIDKYCYVSMRHLPPFFEHKNQFTYSKIERFNNAEDVEHPLVRAALNYVSTDKIQIAYDADLPACSGIGSSSAFAVSLLQGLYALNGKYPDKMQLAKEAIYLEREYLKEAGGVQDQLAAAFGGFNVMHFDSSGYRIEPLDISVENKEKLNRNLLLAFTGFTHFSGEIATEQQKNIPSTIAQLDEMKRLVDEGASLLRSGNTDSFGELLDYTWSLKRSLSKCITNEKIDDLYEKAKEYGAMGGKLIGAGGGGFMLLYVPEEKQSFLKEKLPELQYIPFRFESCGTEIIYSDK
ncbi:MAG: kinase [Clostridia bacterium]|nr:kinase [Clostridia bacterium]